MIYDYNSVHIDIQYILRAFISATKLNNVVNINPESPHVCGWIPHQQFQPKWGQWDTKFGRKILDSDGSNTEADGLVTCHWQVKFLQIVHDNGHLSSFIYDELAMIKIYSITLSNQYCERNDFPKKETEFPKTVTVLLPCRWCHRCFTDDKLHCKVANLEAENPTYCPRSGWKKKGIGITRTVTISYQGFCENVP